MMEDAGADNLVETHPQFAGVLDRQVVHLEVVQLVFALQRLGAAHARGAEIDADHTRRRPSQRMLCGLGGAAAGNQDGEIILVGLGGPEQMVIGAQSLRVLPVTLISVEAVDRRRIGKPLVELLNDPGRIGSHDTPSSISSKGRSATSPSTGLSLLVSEFPVLLFPRFRGGLGLFFSLDRRP
jgi:hypothetical protein